MKDYYNILGLSRDAKEEEVRRAYRRLAFEHHPDRNPGDSTAAERFKEIAEAYGVLIDPTKRRQYDTWVNSGFKDNTGQSGFQYSQEEIFQDLFRDPRFSSIFQELFKEFERAGLRSDRRFFDHTFFGGRGFVFGGVFFFGPFSSARTRMPGAGPSERIGHGQYSEIGPGGFFERLGQKIGGYFFGDKQSLPEATNLTAAQSEDLTYGITLRREDAQRGTSVNISVDRREGRETLKVKIPPTIRSGTRLRLKEKGFVNGSERGDLYLKVTLA